MLIDQNSWNVIVIGICTCSGMLILWLIDVIKQSKK
jgi:hypothetical protein